jgi:DNA-binding SARP family transcriptional activator/tetratricopeptide (TPR) repeat protein
MRIEFSVLGDLEVRVDGRPIGIGHARQRCVLAALLVDANKAVSADQLVDRVWADGRPRHAHSSLYSYLSRIRHTLATVDQVDLIRQSGKYTLAIDSSALDLNRFHQLVSQARTALDEDQRQVLFEQALGLWRGEAFADLNTPWINALRNTLEGQRLAVELDRNDIALGRGHHAALLSELSTRVSAHPWDERLTGQLMLALYRSGRRTEALDQYRRTRRLLAEELGTDPSPPLQSLHQQILSTDPTLTARSHSAPAIPSVPHQPAPPPPSLTGGKPALVWPPTAIRPGVSASASGTAVPPRQLPPPPTMFVGRDRELAGLDSMGGPIVISGMAGVGKTALALHWARQAEHRFDDGQMYVNLHGWGATPPLTPGDALTHLLNGLGVSPHEVPADEQLASAQFRTHTAGRRLLLVLDNARSAEQVRPLLLGGRDGCVIVTSRERLTGLVIRDGAVELNLDVLSPEHATTLINTLLCDDQPEAAELARACGLLPLALRIAAASLVSGRLPIGSLIERLRSGRRLHVLQIRNDPHTAVETAFLHSYEALSSGQRRLFRLLGVLPVTQISGELAAAVAHGNAEETDVEEDLASLVNAHLVMRIAQDRYALHDLMRDFARRQGEIDEPPAERIAAVRRGYDWYLHRAQSAAHTLYPQLVGLGHVDESCFAMAKSAIAWLGAEHDQLVEVVTAAAGSGEPSMAWLIADALRGHFMASRSLATWLKVNGIVLTAARAEGNIRAQASMHLGISLAHASYGSHGKAIDHSEQALNLSVKDGWADCELSALTALGVQYSHLGLTAKAVDFAERALAASRDRDRWAIAAINLNNLGTMNILLGRLDVAERHLEEALTLHSRTGTRRGAASVRINLGTLSHRQGRLESADRHLSAAHSAYRDLSDREGEAAALSHLALVRLATARTAQALESARYALGIVHGMGDPHAEALALTSLAAVRGHARQDRLASAYYQRALRLAERAGHRQSSCVSLIGMAELSLRGGELGSTVAYADRVLELARAAGYAQFEGQALTLLARVHHAQGKRGEAVRLATTARDLHRRTGHRLDLARTLKTLCVVLQQPLAAR